MLIPVILSGGAGTRLWPVSRESHPKPFMRIGDTENLLQKAVRRGITASGAPQGLLVTNKEYYFLSKDALASIELPSDYTFLLEPTGRNTAPAIALAALHIAKNFGPERIMLVLPADQLIRDEERFCSACASAATLAVEGRIVLFGITPTVPETGFGYIQLGLPIAGSPAHQVARFVEKPDVATAAAYLASGDFVWNSGMFCFRADTILRAFGEHAPEILQGAQDAMSEARVMGDKVEFGNESFVSMSSISIDYAIMERTANVAVIPCDFGWSDVGSWKSFSEQLPADPQGNTHIGDTLLIDARDCHVQSDNRTVALIGLDNVVVIDTPDALLVAQRDRVQEVRTAVDELKARGHESVKLHQTVARPWGTYTVLQEGPGFKIKRIEVKPHQALSLQMHHQRSEHWVVVNGVAQVTNGNHTYAVRPNESTYIPVHTRHRLENASDEPLVIIEVQCGSYVGEDDIVRFDDRYQRA